MFRLTLRVLLVLSPLAVAVVPSAVGATSVVSHTQYRIGNQVITQDTHSDGSAVTAIATVAAMGGSDGTGLPPTGLHGSMGSHGSSTLAEPVDCNIQGAYAWGRLCGINRVHWSGTHPAIYFRDHSGAAWPVYEAVVQWNHSTALDAGYRTPSWVCPNGVHCVDVYSGTYYGECGAGFTNWVGCTFLYTDGNRNITNSTYIMLNDRFPHSYAQNQATSCHELGHALGLDHNLFTSSCLYYTPVGSGVSKYPSNADFLMLESIY